MGHSCQAREQDLSQRVAAGAARQRLAASETLAALLSASALVLDRLKHLGLILVSDKDLLLLAVPCKSALAVLLPRALRLLVLHRRLASEAPAPASDSGHNNLPLVSAPHSKDKDKAALLWDGRQ